MTRKVLAWLRVWQPAAVCRQSRPDRPGLRSDLPSFEYGAARMLSEETQRSHRMTRSGSSKRSVTPGKPESRPRRSIRVQPGQIFAAGNNNRQDATSFLTS